MARWATLFAAILLFTSGCGDATPLSSTDQGLKALRSGKYDQAIEICSRAIDAKPGDAEAYLYRGRAYQFRNAMGDPQRAIADFTEAIRLAPDVADAYYSRAIVYRDLGQVELAKADDQRARKADGLLQDVYRKLPTPPQTTLVDAPPEAPEKQPEDLPDPLAPADADDLFERSAFEQREVYEKLKKRFEPELAEDAKESPIERYNRLSRQAFEQDDSTSYESLRPQNTPDPTPPLTDPLAPRLTEEPGFSRPSTARPTPRSPFAPPLPDTYGGGNSNAPRPSYRPVQSPFGQRAPSPTGFGTRQANPTGQQPAPRTIGQPPRVDGRYSNPAVRPDNPRDYVP